MVRLISDAAESTWHSSCSSLYSLLYLAITGSGNILQFGEGIIPADLRLGLGSLLIRVGDTGGAIHLTTFDPAEVFGAHDIDTFRFADGTVLSYAELLARGFDISGTDGVDVLTGTSVVDRIEGLDGNDIIDAGAGDDTLDGGAGVDSLIGGAGDDLLDGGAGVDALTGGAGNDTCVVENTGDVVTEFANEGLDTVRSNVSYTLGANLENLTLTGTSNLGRVVN